MSALERYFSSIYIGRMVGIYSFRLYGCKTYENKYGFWESPCINAEFLSTRSAEFRDKHFTRLFLLTAFPITRFRFACLRVHAWKDVSHAPAGSFPYKLRASRIAVALNSSFLDIFKVAFSGTGIVIFVMTARATPRQKCRLVCSNCCFRSRNIAIAGSECRCFPSIWF